MAVKKSVAKVAKVSKKEETISNIRLYTNDYGIKMVEIEHGTRPQYISLSKVKGILDVLDFPSLMTPVVFKGRDLFSINYGANKTFKVGTNKIEAVRANRGALQGLVVDNEVSLSDEEA